MAICPPNTPPEVAARWQQADRHDTQILALLESVFGEPFASSTLDADRQAATDYISESGAVRVACRVRSADAAQKWPFDFTTRTTGKPSELDKTRAPEGPTAYLTAYQEAGKLTAWALADLAVLRAFWASEPQALASCKRFKTPDGSGLAVDFRRVPPAVLIASCGIRELSRLAARRAAQRALAGWAEGAPL